jgi:RNA polymerase sigma-70 factor (ECF subfamily)
VERELVQAARAGDESAFGRLIEAEAPRVYRAVLAVVRSPQDAQEVIQDASIRAWRQLGGLRDVDRWPAWYRRIAVRQALDRAGRLGGRRLREVRLASIAGHGDGDGPVPHHDPTSAWVAHAAVNDALAKLSNEDRVLLGLRFGADLEVPDVATALGIPLGTAKSRLHRALARLAAAMGDDDEQR